MTKNQKSILANTLKKKTTTNKLCGSGFFLKNNYIITNAHVVENMDNLKIELINGKKYTSTIIGKNIDYDICILKIKPFKTVKLLKFNSKDLKIGNIVILQQKSKIDFLSHFKKKVKINS